MTIQEAIPDQEDFNAVDIANKLYPNAIRYDREGRLHNRAIPTVTRMLRKQRGIIEVKGKHLVFWADKILFKTNNIMKYTAEQLDTFLNLFISHNETRPVLNEPMLLHKKGESKVWATNAHVITSIDSEHFEKSMLEEYDRNVKYPDCYAVIERYDLKQRSKPREVNVKELLEELKQYQIHRQYQECDNCDGDGQVECHCCGSTGECIECDGSGDNGTFIKMGYSKIGTSSVQFSKNNSKYLIHYVDKIFTALNVLKVEKVECVFIDNTNLEIKFDGIFIMCMGCTEESQYHSIIQ